MAETLSMRKDVPVGETWDISLIYKTEDLLWQDVEEAKKLADEIAAMKGTLNTPQSIVSCMQKKELLQQKMTLIGDYSYLAVSVNYYDTQALERDGKLSGIFSQIHSKLSFVEGEIADQSEQTIADAMQKAGRCAGALREILRAKPHRLSSDAEKVIAAYGEVLQAPYAIYEQTKLADMVFDSFCVNDKEYPPGYSLFEDDYEFEHDTDVRRSAFKSFSDKIRQYQNVTATAYNTYVRNCKITADLRGFRDVFDSLLFSQHVTREMYDRQIDVIMEKLAPHMRRYAKLLQHTHGLDKMTYADLKLPLDQEYDPKVTIEESKEYILKGLSVMGEEYAAMIREAYDNRWVDFAKNQGKSTGGFCASPYGKNSFILLSWNNRMADVITLAHELGHAGHFRACNNAQSIFDTDVSTYFIEAPSTMNELLMANYLKSTSTDARFRRWVLSCMVGNTYYHNMVTHLLQAAYQRQVYRVIEQGGSVHAEMLNRIMRETLEKFWGETVEMTEGAELTWMRQPHYYMGLYSYTYSAGLTVATQVAKRIENEGAPAVEDWKKVLQAGSTLDPVGLAALAKVDITTDAALLDTIETIGSMIDEMWALTEEIEKQ